jgi:hypothetical protein
MIDLIKLNELDRKLLTCIKEHYIEGDVDKLL